MNLRIVRESVARLPCLGCEETPRREPHGALWIALLNEQGKQIVCFCSNCSDTMAHAYLKQVAKRAG